ncbi:hypothetical protein N7466_008441 [Penicillium verhagenii]|uniref:uncharacterized protein n=1 Tax=Penicillium verhagenii TaxID=1562060 RepID=UPI0025455293|nr:uncharacterized protein N7466_008441 [Penicillium verhagenii]KAJ5924254.1 hypothetical protein N7466_008441 [Penicillium verhagenii]
MRRHPKSLLGLFESPLLHKGHIQPSIRTLTPRFQSSSSNDSRSDQTNLNTRHGTTVRHKPKNYLHSERLPIGVTSLGEPGEVVIVPPKIRRRPQHSGPNALGEGEGQLKEDPSSVSAILHDMDEESVETTAEIIRVRMEGLRTYRPKQKLTASEWEDLQSTIVSSFSRPQLSQYVAAYNHDMPISEDNLAPWRPGTSAFILKTGSRLRPRLDHKMQLAEHILREFWQLSILDEVGHLDLTLPPLYINLLLAANNFSFDEVAGLHKSSIDITHSLGLVRITGTETSCESTCEVISDAAARIQEEQVGIDFVTVGTRFTPNFIDWVCQTYGVEIDRQAVQGPERILYLKENKRGAEEARRTLGLAAHGANPSPQPFSTYLPASEPANVYDYTPETTASWLDQQKSWFRWAMPAVQTTATEPQPTPFFNGHNALLSNTLLKLLRDQREANPVSLGGFTLQESVTAAVGRCLFNRKSTFDETTISASQLGKLSLPRTFVPDVPRIKPFLDSLSPIAPENGIPIHVVRLIPLPGSSGNLPELEVEFSPKTMNASGASQDPISIHGVRFILDTNSVDFLLPETGLDLRFTRTLHLQASAETVTDEEQYEELLNSIKQSLRDTFTSPSSIEGSSLPAFGHIRLPQNIFPSCLHTKTEGKVDSVEYIFPPMNDARGAVAQRYHFEGTQLSYRFYESGPFLAARTTEVSLDMNIPQDTMEVVDGESQDAVEQNFHSFYNTACDMAFKIDKARYPDEHDG